MSLSTMGLRVGLGVSVGSSGLVGTSAGTTCSHTAGTQPRNKGKATAPHGSPKDSAHCMLVQNSVPVAFQCDGHGMRPPRGPAPGGPVTVRLSNLPRHLRADDVQAMLAPWSEAVVGLSDAGMDADTRAFDAEMSNYNAAEEAISELHNIDVGGNFIVVSSADIFKTNRLSSDGGSAEELCVSDELMA